MSRSVVQLLKHPGGKRRGCRCDMCEAVRQVAQSSHHHLTTRVPSLCAPAPAVLFLCLVSADRSKDWVLAITMHTDILKQTYRICLVITHELLHNRKTNFSWKNWNPLRQRNHSRTIIRINHIGVACALYRQILSGH